MELEVLPVVRWIEKEMPEGKKMKKMHEKKVIPKPALLLVSCKSPN